jgi:hypothetical protein
MENKIVTRSLRKQLDQVENGDAIGNNLSVD